MVTAAFLGLLIAALAIGGCIAILDIERWWRR